MLRRLADSDVKTLSDGEVMDGERRKGVTLASTQEDRDYFFSYPNNFYCPSPPLFVNFFFSISVEAVDVVLNAINVRRDRAFTGTQKAKTASRAVT